MQRWRKIILVLMLVAIIGPWAIERLSIPEPYECENGFRIDENFCGYPISGMQIFIMLFGNIFGSAFRLFVSDGNFTEFAISFCAVLFILLPMTSMLLLIASKEKPFGGGDGAHLGILTFAVILGMIGISREAVEIMWELWGIWLYLLLLISEWALELLKQGSKRMLGSKEKIKLM
jgi:hypothetical protein